MKMDDEDDQRKLVEDTLNKTELGNYYNSTTSFLGSLLTCPYLSPPQHLMYHLANTCFLISYVPPSRPRGLLFMHSLLIIGFLLYSTWAWNVICAPDVFSWNFTCMLLNMGQTLYIAYQMRPVKIRKELQPLYQALFEPLHVPRYLFKRLVSIEYAQMMTLHEGEAYAMCNLTKTDRLGLLIEGKANVLSPTHFLHSISPMEFLDSPEYESSRTSIEAKFKVTVVAATACRYLFWQRSSLEYFFVKEPYMATVMATLIARDITSKLYSMNHKIVTEKGSQLDIRLPSLTSSLSSSMCDSLSHKSPSRSTKSPGSHLKSSELSLAASLPIMENKNQFSMRTSPDMSKSVESQSSSRRTLSSNSPRSPRRMDGRRYSGGRSKYYGSPTHYSPRKGGLSLPSSFKSDSDFLDEEDELEEDLGYLLTEEAKPSPVQGGKSEDSLTTGENKSVPTATSKT